MKKKNEKLFELKKEDIRVKLIETPGLFSDEPINTPSAALSVMKEALMELDREYVCVVNLDNQLRPICYNIASIGTVNSSIASTNEIFKSAILSNAASIMLIHNHPSFGIPKPSKNDDLVTKKVLNASYIMDIPLIDHVIVSASKEEYSYVKSSSIFKENFNLDKAIKMIDDDKQLAFDKACEESVEFKSKLKEIKALGTKSGINDKSKVKKREEER